jgi:hypothetical protein
MPRLHLFELHDFHWCPRTIREGLTDFLETSIRTQDTYGPVKTRILEALSHSGASQIVDLCSGGGGPWIQWLRKGEIQSTAILTDKFPNQHAQARLSRLALPGISYCEQPVDVAAVPADLLGFRTLFTSFHHFRPEQAKNILRDAVAHRQPIGIFEFTSRKPKALMLMLLSPLAVWFMTPRAQNASLLKWVFTYPLPIIPLVVTIDGIISCLRTYSVNELKKMADAATEQASGYVWLAGEEQGSPFPITYLIGYPSEN